MVGIDAPGSLFPPEIEKSDEQWLVMAYASGYVGGYEGRREGGKEGRREGVIFLWTNSLNHVHYVKYIIVLIGCDVM